MRYIVVVFLLSCILITGCRNSVLNTEPETEKYAYYKGNQLIIAELVTDKEWEGNKSREISYTAKQAPWVFNANFNRISDIAAKYKVYIYRKEHGPLLSEDTYDKGIESLAVINDIGEYIINIRVSGMSWEAKIGVEP